MIGSLRGVVLERIEDSTVLVEVGGVGYLVTVTPRTLAELEPTSSAFLYVHQHVREDAQTLFGFLDRDERRTFESLIDTHGIGPSMAMSILATHSPRALTDIVANGDVASLTLVPGVGKKTAERMCVELRDRLPKAIEATPASPADSMREDLGSALANLGYHRQAIDKVLDKLLGGASDRTFEEVLRAALKDLSRA